jgi:hypothetical protein
MGSSEDFGALGQALPPVWRRYREAFAVLQHICNLGGAAAGARVSWSKVVSELGLTGCQGDEVLAYLLATGCVEQLPGPREVALTQPGLNYLACERRRRSIRPRALDHSGRVPISQRRTESSASWAVSPLTQSRSRAPRS